MRKLGILGAALFAVLAFTALAASAASAEIALWLVNGADVLALTSAETEGTVLLRQYSEANGASILNEVECTGIFDGSIGPEGEDEITKVLTTGTMVDVGADNATLTGEGLTCAVKFDAGALTDCEVGATNALVYPANLPWHTQLELMADGTILDIITGTNGEPGWETVCHKSLLGVEGAELCTGPASTLMENFAGTPASVLGFFNAVPVAERGNCGTTGEHSAEVVSDTSGDTWAIGAELERLATSVSEP
jgi:hypothetical protein